MNVLLMQVGAVIIHLAKSKQQLISGFSSDLIGSAKSLGASIS